MLQDEVMSLLHCAGSSLPPICPCNMANASDTKTHWSAKELHCMMGCQKFCNYKHLLQVSHDGEWVEGGKVPPSLGLFATIPKAKQGLPLDWMSYHYLDAVHMDIAFGNCLLVGGFRCALILVDCAMQYNWMFGLKSLSSEHILGTLRLFCAAAGALAQCFYSDCNTKLFGTAIAEYLIDDDSKVITAPAKHQSANSLVKSH
jgi:hypothetical protein